MICVHRFSHVKEASHKPVFSGKMWSILPKKKGGLGSLRSLFNPSFLVDCRLLEQDTPHAEG
jgi:hypothetical protein